MVSINNLGLNENGWIIDSGANQQMIISDKRLKNVVDIKERNLKLVTQMVQLLK